MRAARLLSIQMMLETRGRLSARELAGALEISVRTLHRDIDHLSAAGVPVIAERGPAGGFRLMEGWSTRLTGFTPDEARAVFLGGLAGPAAQLGMQETMRSAQLKLTTALPVAWREGARRVQARLHLDPVDWYKEPDPVPHLSVIAEAVWTDRRLAITYQGWQRRASLVTDPLGLVLKAGTWYFVGSTDGAARTYRIASVMSVELAPGSVKRPKGFDLEKYWRESVSRFETSLYTGIARVAATEAGLLGLKSLNSAASRAVAGIPAPAPGKRAVVRLPVESIEVAVGQLMSLGSEVEVLSPLTLRRAMRDRLRATGRLYR